MREPFGVRIRIGEKIVLSKEYQSPTTIKRQNEVQSAKKNQQENWSTLSTQNYSTGLAANRRVLDHCEAWADFVLTMQHLK